ncbi:hypothetical protein [Streptomyces sp. NPDC059970]|uniref:hypothetical protein n=1 Tax=Streptomyces sp. NPDC059970 TaxID=3347019 RepID=UPI0036757454
MSVADAVVALHATGTATVFLSGGARMSEAQRADGEPVWRLLSDIDRDATAVVEAEASRLSP